MRILVTRYFARIAEHEGLTDKAICKAVEELESGLHDGNLGGNVYKKRLGIGSSGKRGGMRTIVAMRLPSNVFFLYGYPKNDKGNITNEELMAFRKVAKSYLPMDAKAIDHLIKRGELVEVKRHEKK